MQELRTVDSQADLAIARQLFEAYAAELGIDLSFQKFSEEIEDLGRQYTMPNRGALVLLFDNNDEAGGCFGVRKIEDTVCELKRMYLAPPHRGKGLGSQMMNEAFTIAKELGYESMRLDTLSSMHSAVALYKRYGFYEIEPYYHNPLGSVVYFEKKLN